MIDTSKSAEDPTACILYHGPGIEPEYHQRIFDMFSTLRSRDEVEGSGIGLALIKKIVERWGGQVSVISVPGERGATFRFTMPSITQAAA